MKKERLKPGKLPHGSGSIQKRGATLWIIYPNAKRRTIQENARTLDWDEAWKLLLRRATRTLEERLAELRSIADAAQAARGGKNHGHRAPGAGGNGERRGHRAPAAADARNRKKSAQGGTR
jgi:hypothetical protein